MILANRDEEAVTLIQQADITALFDVRKQACNAPPVFSVHRLRKVASLLPNVPKEQRAPQFASESPLGEAVFRHDGWRCRYCGCRVIPSRVRRWMDKRLPGAVRWDDNGMAPGCHAGFWTLWGTVDHVVPRARGGRNEPANLVTACVVCNFAKDHYTLEQVGLADPRCRQPVLDGWDGLTRLVTNSTRRTPGMHFEPRTPSPQPSRGPTAKAEPASQRAKPMPRAPLLSPAEYYAQLETRRPHSAQPLQVFLTSLEEVGVAVELFRSVVLRFPLGAGGQVSAGSILTDGRVFSADAYYYSQKHGHRDIGERYLAALADLSDGEVRAAGRVLPEMFSRSGRQINVTDLLSNAALWKNAISDFVSDMRPAMHTDIL